MKADVTGFDDSACATVLGMHNIICCGCALIGCSFHVAMRENDTDQNSSLDLDLNEL